MKFLILGSGKMAKAISYYLKKYSVTVASRHPRKFWSQTKTKKLDVTKFNSVVKAMKGFDCVVSAVPYDLNYNLAKAAVQAQVSFVDLGGNDVILKKQLTLHSKAKKKNIALVPGCGLSPGLSSTLVGLGMEQFEKADSVKIYVGGLPVNPQGPLKYMLTFSIKGLLNEYMQPCKVFKNNKKGKCEPLSDIEYVTFPKVGRLEAFNTSGGLMTLPKSYKGKIKYMFDKTLRYPGHAEKIKELIQYVPRDVLESVLQKELSYSGKDVVLLRIELRKGKKKIVYELIDYQKGALTAMMRSTGFHAAVVAEMVVQGLTQKGVLKLETDVNPREVVKRLKKAGLQIRIK